MKSYEDFKNKPLPDHTKIDYWECLAKLTLENFFSDDFSNLMIVDKPDLQSDNAGIEVTKAINPEQERNESLYVKIENGQIKDRENAIRVINNSYKPRKAFINGVEIRETDRYDDGILAGIPERINFKRIIKAFEEKVKKLNAGGYKLYLSNMLFVYSYILANQSMIDEAINEMRIIQSRYKYKYSKVYIYVPSYIYVLDLIKNKGEIIDIKEYQYFLGTLAREMVIEEEIKG